ncbi:hypothetical protein [Streptomyces mexicanus]|jgi:hypothetical protein|uniref:hypothetical protein n=1 Tax=Streptomyces mexicanus TaxID=178566 RepID=UPI003682170E
MGEPGGDGDVRHGDGTKARTAGCSSGDREDGGGRASQDGGSVGDLGGQRQLGVGDAGESGEDCAVERQEQ